MTRSRLTLIAVTSALSIAVVAALLTLFGPLGTVRDLGGPVQVGVGHDVTRPPSPGTSTTGTTTATTSTPAAGQAAGSTRAVPPAAGAAPRGTSAPRPPSAAPAPARQAAPAPVPERRVVKHPPPVPYDDDDRPDDDRDDDERDDDERDDDDD